MRQLPARYRNAYHRTLTSSQRRNRWLLWVGVGVLAIGGNRWVASCQQAPAPPPPHPREAVRVAQVSEALRPLGQADLSSRPLDP